jgi:hypothetical protein
MKDLKKEITYKMESGFPIPTFHCQICKTDTEGFSICLKCNPQTYEVSKPDVIKAALSVGIIQCKICDKPKPDPNSIWRCLNCNGKLYTVPKTMMNKFDISNANLGSTKKGHAIPNNSVYTKEIWNAAIEEVIKTLIKKVYVSNELKFIIRGLKK